MSEPAATETGRPGDGSNANTGGVGVGAALVATVAAFVVLGLPEGILGTAWPSVRTEFGQANSGLAVLLAGFTVGYTVSSAASGHLTERLGTSRVMGLAITTGATGVVALLVAPGFEWVVGAYVVLGAGNGTIDSVGNAWTALTRGPRAMGLVHAAFGVGATIGPLLSAGLISAGASWRWPFAVLVAGQTIALVLVMSNRRGFDRAPRHPEVAARAATTTQPSPRLLPLMLTWFAVYVGVEVAIGQWSFTLLTEQRGLSDGVAGALVAAYWGGLTVGRLGLGAIGHLLQAERLMTAATGLALLATGLLWLDPGGAGAAALPLAGLAFAPMFPVMVNRTPVYLGPERSNRAVGYQLAASSLGFVTTPLLIGVLADRHGVGVASPVSFAAVVVLSGVWAAVFSAAQPSGRRHRRHQSPLGDRATRRTSAPEG